MSTTTTTTTSPTLTTWTIDPDHTHVEFAVRHLMISTTRGRFTDVRGTLSMLNDDATKSTVDIAIGVASVDTREAQRDAHLRGTDFFDADNYPDITFRSGRVEAPSDGVLKVFGDLTIHGVTRAVALDVRTEGRGRDPWGGERIGFSAATSVKRSDFGLTWNIALEMGGVAVGDEVKISIDCEFVKSN